MHFSFSICHFSCAIANRETMTNEKWQMINDQCFYYSLYPSASYEHIAVVEDRCLARTDRRLRLIEFDSDAIGFERDYRRRCFVRSIAYSHVRSHRLVGIIDRHPVYAARRQRFSIQLASLPDDELVAGHVNLQHVQRLTGSHSDAAALTNGIAMQTRVLADDPSVRRRDLASADSQVAHLVPPVILNKPSIVAVGHETYLLTLGLVGGFKSKLSRDVTHFALGHLAQRKLRARKLFLRHLEQEVRLIF